jgi:ribulose-5-phosphate 4-epimerase/fuculose-1-phosphate aldolase
VQVSPRGTPGGNPAFDVTPARLVTGLITETPIIATCRAMNASGINQGTAGNVSPPYDDMTPDMIVRLPLVGPPGDGLAMKPSTEWRFHQALLAARTDMAAVVHAHPPHATAVSASLGRVALTFPHFT